MGGVSSNLETYNVIIVVLIWIRHFIGEIFSKHYEYSIVNYANETINVSNIPCMHIQLQCDNKTPVLQEAMRDSMAPGQENSNQNAKHALWFR